MTDRQAGVAEAYSGTIVRGSNGLPMWPQVIAALAAVLLTTGAVIALFNPSMLVGPHEQINEAVRVYAGYLASRNFALAGFLLSALVWRSKVLLNYMLLLTASIQLVDAMIDCLEARWMVVPGVTILAVLFFAGAAGISRFPFWRAKAWDLATR
jgi:hypothetical protein